MDLTFRDPGLDYSVHGILLFQTEAQSDWWRESLFMFYPQVDRQKFEMLRPEEQAPYLRDILKDIYAQNQAVIADKLVQYQHHWQANRQQIEAAFSDVFGVDTSALFNDLLVNVTLNPICPRFLAEHTFDLFYLNSERGALGMSLHEMIHFVWFHIWHRLFEDASAEYEAPSLKWVFSEMAVDPIMRDPRLCSINPYFADGCAYEYFYSMRIDGAPILDTLYAMLKTSPIEAFMRQGYAFCQQHEDAIRSQMK